MSLTVLILTLNEQENLPACLASLKWWDDIIAHDSLSTDRTVDIAKREGARVIQREFDNCASHQNWAMVNIPYKYEWYSARTITQVP